MKAGMKASYTHLLRLVGRSKGARRRRPEAIVRIRAYPTDLRGAHIVALRSILARHGFAEDMVWSETVKPPSTSDGFAKDAIFVICNSGMKHQIAQAIYKRVFEQALFKGLSAETQFGHKNKARAIDFIWQHRDRLFREYERVEVNEKLSWLEGLPHIGPITKYHLAKNFGIDCAKPDVHLTRLADLYNTDTHELCARLAAETGLRIATVDLLLWRACALGLIHAGGRRWRARNSGRSA